MNLVTILLTGAFLIDGLGAHATINNQSAIEQTHAPAHTINEPLTTKVASF